MLNGNKSFQRDYLILFVDTLKSNNTFKTTKMMLFDLKLDKISMVYNLPENILKGDSNNNIVLPNIKILNDYLHFIIYNPSCILVYDLFCKDPIVNISSSENKIIKFVEFSFDYKKMAIIFTNGDLIVYNVISSFDEDLGIGCVFMYAGGSLDALVRLSDFT